MIYISLLSLFLVVISAVLILSIFMLNRLVDVLFPAVNCTNHTFGRWRQSVCFQKRKCTKCGYVEEVKL